MSSRLASVTTAAVTEYAFPGLLTIDQCDAVGRHVAGVLVESLAVTTMNDYLALPDGALVKDQLGYGQVCGRRIERLTPHWLIYTGGGPTSDPQLPAIVLDWPSPR